MRPKRPAPGDIVAGRYKLLRQLGAGGFGVVFHARQESMGRDVAIKFLQPKISNDPVAIERFRREAYHSSGLRHPNTITLHDYGQTDDGLFYIIMEFLEGEVLGKAVFREGGLSLGRAMRIGAQVLRALGEAHSKGLIHRDLKPENIFLVNVLGETDFVKVLDFGLSKALQTENSTFDEPTLTQAGKVFGTPYYMSPEQAYGEELTPSADVFAFGLLFYEMLVGQRPFKGPTPFDVLTKLTKEPLPRLRPPLANGPIQEYLDMLTAKEVRDRFKNAVEAVEPLNRLIAGEGLESLGDLDQVFVGKGKRRAASKPAPARQPYQRPKRRFGDQKVVATRRVKLEDAAQAAQAASPRARQRFGAGPSPKRKDDDIFSSLFAPEELEASRRSPALARPNTENSARQSNSSQPARGRRRRHSSLGFEDKQTVISSSPPPNSQEMPTIVAQMGQMVWKDVPLFGRDNELNSLMAWAERTKENSGGFLLIEGEPGVGKSRLMSAFQQRLDQSGFVRVLRGGYDESNGEYHGGLRRAVESLCDTRGVDDARARELVARKLNELDMASPEAERILLGIIRPATVVDARGTFSLKADTKSAFTLLEKLIFRAAKRSALVLILDDIEMADPFTVSFLEYVSASVGAAVEARNTHPASHWPVLVVATVRSGYQVKNRELTTIVQSISRVLNRFFARMELGPLESKDAQGFCGHVMDLQPAVFERILEATHGNPLHMLHTLRFLTCERILRGSGKRNAPASLTEADLVPSTFESVIERRCDQLSLQFPGRERLGRMVVLASLLGLEFSVKLLETYLVHLGEAEIVRKLDTFLDDLDDEGIIERVGRDRILFSHMLVREALTVMLAEDDQRKHYHEAAARAKEALAVEPEKSSPEFLAELARHWRAAGDTKRAVDCSLQEADSAVRSGDLRLAAELFRDMEDELARQEVRSPQRYKVQYELGRVYARLGIFGVAEDVLGDAAGTASRIEDSSSEGKANVLLGKLFTWQGRYREALRCFRRAVACFSNLKNTTRIDLTGLAEAQYGQAEVARVRGDLDAAEAEFQRALEKATQSDAAAVEGNCLHGLGRIAHVRGDLRKAMEHLAEAASRFSKVGMPLEAAVVNVDLGLAEMAVHGPARAYERVEPAARSLTASGEKMASAHAMVHMGLILSRQGRLKEALEQAAEALKSFQSLHHEYGVGRATLLRGELLARMGKTDEALKESDRALRMHESISDTHGTALSLLMLGTWNIDQARTDEGEAQLKHALDIMDGAGIGLHRPMCLMSLGRAAAMRGAVEQASQHYSESYASATRTQNMEVQALSVCELGELTFAHGRFADSRGYLEKALSVGGNVSLTEVRLGALFLLAWQDSLNGNFNRRKTYMAQVASLDQQLEESSTFLHLLVRRTSRIVSALRGPQEAQRYQQSAVNLLNSLA